MDEIADRVQANLNQRLPILHELREMRETMSALTDAVTALDAQVQALVAAGSGSAQTIADLTAQRDALQAEADAAAAQISTDTTALAGLVPPPPA